MHNDHKRSNNERRRLYSILHATTSAVSPEIDNMSDSESDISSCASTSFSSSLDNVAEEFEDLNALEEAQENSSDSEHGLPNEDDPIADEAYQAAFNKARRRGIEGSFS